MNFHDVPAKHNDGSTLRLQTVLVLTQYVQRFATATFVKMVENVGTELRRHIPIVTPVTPTAEDTTSTNKQGQRINRYTKPHQNPTKPMEAMIHQNI